MRARKCYVVWWAIALSAFVQGCDSRSGQRGVPGVHRSAGPPPDVPPASAAAPGVAAVSQEARDAIVLLIDAQARCIRVANGEVSILNASSEERARQRELSSYTRDVAEPELAVVDRTLEDLEKLWPGLEKTTPEQVFEPVDVMSKAVKELREVLKPVDMMADAVKVRLVAEGSELDRLENALTRQTSVFRAAERRLSRVLEISHAERREILARYRHGRGFSGSLAKASTGNDSGRVIDDAPSREQYDKEKREWDEFVAKKERQEAERHRLEAQAREEAAERRRNSLRESTPSAGLNPEAQARIAAAEKPEIDPLLQQKFESWHRTYKKDMIAFKVALSQFMLIKEESGQSVRRTRACQDLIRGSSEMLGKKAIFDAPEPSLGRTLKLAFSELYEAGKSCVDGDHEAQTGHADSAFADFAEVAEMLRPYGLEP